MKRIIICVILAAVIVCLSFGFLEYKEDDIDTNSSIIFASVDIPNNLKNTNTLSNEGKNILCAVSRGLVDLNEEGEVIPSLAGSYSKSDDGIEYNFILKDNIYWSDGSEITSKDVKDYFKELLKTEDEENISAILNIYGAKEFKYRSANFENGVAITYDNNELKIRLNKKDDNFLKELTKPQYRLKKQPKSWNDLKSIYDSIDYSGEYKIMDIGEDYIELKKNEYVKDNIIEDIKFVKDESKEEAMASYELGERDIVINPPSSQLNRLSEKGRLKNFKSNEGVYLIMPESEGLTLANRRELYKLIYEFTNDYADDNPKEIEAAEGSYFREDKQDLNKLQSRKVSMNLEEDWQKPKKIKMAVIDNEDMRLYYSLLEEYFNKNDITLECSYIKDNYNYNELKSKYDMIMVVRENDSKNKDALYNDLNNFVNIDLNSKDKEEGFFNNYVVLPIMFMNENIASSDRIKDIVVDGNGSIDFQSMTKSRVKIS